VVFANYGHYIRNPLYRHLYLQGTLEDAVPLIGNPHLEVERSRCYEFGFRHLLTERVQLTTTIWVREMSGLTATERIPSFFQGVSNPYSYWVFLNYDHALARGLDLTLRKRFSGLWSGSLGYSFMTSEVNRDEPMEGFDGDMTLTTMPKRLHPLTWEQPHRLATTLNLRLPEGWGPTLLESHPLEKITLSLIHRLEAGRPYTPTTREAVLERNSDRLPWTGQLDLHLYRDISLMHVSCGLFVDIRNVFDRRNALVVYSRTGSPDDPGPGSTGYSDDYDRSHYFRTRRQIDVGIRVRF
jgi:outer membrane receptor protein involved in Fe transport